MGPTHPEFPGIFQGTPGRCAAPPWRVRYSRHIAALLILTSTGTTAAQTPEDAPPPAPGTTPPGDTPPAAAPAPAVPSPPGPAIEARLDEIEQLARVADRKHEILEEAAEKKRKEAPVTSVSDKGFTTALPDGSYALKVRGLVQVDGRSFLGNEGLSANDTFVVRRFRPFLEGTLFSLVDFRLMPELAGGVQVLDAYVDVHPWTWLRLRVGKYKAPIGLERLQSDPFRVFLEQSLVQNLSSQRDVGVQLWGDVAEGRILYAAGIFNGAPDNSTADTDLNRAKDFQGRLFFHPFRGDAELAWGMLGLGFAAATGNRAGRPPAAVDGLVIPTVPAATGLSPFRTSGQNPFFQYLAPPADTTGELTTFADGRATRLNPQLYYYLGGFGLLAEYLWLSQGVRRGDSTAVLRHQAALVTASWVLNGAASYEGATPRVPFDPTKGAWGALEIGARWSWIAVDNDSFGDPAIAGSVQYANPGNSVRSAHNLGGVVTWVPRRSVHFALSFEQTRFEGGAGTAAAVTDRPTENVVIGRGQVTF